MANLAITLASMVEHIGEDVIAGLIVTYHREIGKMLKEKLSSYSTGNQNCLNDEKLRKIEKKLLKKLTERQKEK